MSGRRSRAHDWRQFVFKNRGALLVPVALTLALFGKPTATSIGIGVTISAIGEALRVWAVGFSGVTTRAGVVTAPALVTAGPYAIVRNPLYVANGIIAIGFWLAFTGRVGNAERIIMLAVVLTMLAGVYAAIVPLEEAYLSDAFGTEFQRYRERVPRVLPVHGSLPPPDRKGTWHANVIGRAEVITLVLFGLMTLVAIVKLRAG